MSCFSRCTCTRLFWLILPGIEYCLDDTCAQQFYSYSPSSGLGSDVCLGHYGTLCLSLFSCSISLIHSSPYCQSSSTMYALAYFPVETVFFCGMSTALLTTTDVSYLNTFLTVVKLLKQLGMSAPHLTTLEWSLLCLML